MVKATVWLAKEDRQLLERLAPKFGGRAATVREALRRLAADHDRKEAFGAFTQAREGDSIVASYRQVPQDPAEDAAALANAIAMTEAEPWRYKAGS